jgi:hypothetical protein
MRKLWWLCLLALCFASPARAESDIYCLTGSGLLPWQPASTANPCPVSASVSASISGFLPVSHGTPISVTTGGVSGTLPTNTGEVVATNVGTTNGAYCALGASATTSDQYIAPNGGWFGFTVTGSTQLTCITSTSTTTVNMVGGSGLPTGTGGGGGGSSGGGGAVYGPTAVGSATANPPVPVGGSVDGTATGNVSIWKVLSGVGYVNATLNAETSKVIGTVNQGTSPWIVAGGGTAGTPGTAVLTMQGISGGTAVPVSGTFYQTTQPVSIASAGIASGAIASGALASGSIAAGAVSAGAYVSGSVLSGAFASGSLAAGSMVDLLTMRGAVGAGAAPADALIGGAIYNSTPITVTNTQSAALQSDANGFLKVNVAAGGSGGAVYGPTANGSAAANPPVIIGGTATGGATGNVANAMIVAGNTAGITNPAIVVADPNVLAGVLAPVPGYYATAYNTCSQTTGTTAPICVDLNGNMYANISRYMGTAGSANASVMTVQGISGGTAVQAAATLNATPSLANGNGVVPTQGGSVLSATNGLYANLMVGNAAVAVGTGAQGSTVPRVTVATDTATIAGSAPGTAGSPSTNVVTTQPPATGQVAVSTAPTTAGNTAQVVDLRPDSPGIVALGQATKANSVPVTFASDQDPCSYAQKSSVAIAITTATTTSLVPVSGSTAVYVCGFSFSASNVITTANILSFEYGTSTSCTGTHALTGGYGTGSVVAAAPTAYSAGNGSSTVFSAPASNGICAVTTIGATGSFEGVLTYVQQ